MFACVCVCGVCKGMSCGRCEFSCARVRANLCGVCGVCSVQVCACVCVCVCVFVMCVCEFCECESVCVVVPVSVGLRFALWCLTLY